MNRLPTSTDNMPYCFSGFTTQSICTVVSRMSYLCCAWSKLLFLLLLAAATAAPHNIWVLCPTLATYLKNTRRQPARLFIRGSEEPISAEGITQGDPLSMSLYAISPTTYNATARFKRSQTVLVCWWRNRKLFPERCEEMVGWTIREWPSAGLLP